MESEFFRHRIARPTIEPYIDQTAPSERPCGIIGVAAGGGNYSVNGDDGNQNYNTGIFTNAAKITSELQFSYKSFGGFVRGFAFYDFENENSDRARTPQSDDALDRVGSRAEFRDAFLYLRFNIGGRPAEVRGGWQAINWGESTFIQGGINAINPVDVSVLRVPGAELRDALLPVGAVKLSLKPTDSTSIEGFYQFTWEELF